jgi:hypothetical protein
MVTCFRRVTALRVDTVTMVLVTGILVALWRSEWWGVVTGMISVVSRWSWSLSRDIFRMVRSL